MEKREKGERMSVFGPKYPSPLQHVVTHGERLCELLAHAERSDAARGELWLRGRAEEVELVFEVTLFDWASARISLSEARGLLESYLGEVHAGVREHLGLEALGCCDDEDVLTAPSRTEVETVLAPSPRVPAPISSSDTWFDPGTLIHEAAGVPFTAGEDGASSTRGAKR